MKKKEDLRIKKTKRNLYEGLLTIMKDKPFEDIKVNEICNVALTNRSTFYDHFNDKYELLSSLIKDLELELIEKLDENDNIVSDKDYYMKVIEILFDHICENIDIYSSIIKNNNNSIASDMFLSTLLIDVKKHIEDNDRYHGNIPIDIITTFYVSAVTSICLEYIRKPKKYSKEDILKYIDELLPNDIY